jgi:hypothetical protein
MIPVILLFLLAMSFSALYSGSETGFYRAARGRLVVDARSGDWVSRGLLWLTNNPAVFVATHVNRQQCGQLPGLSFSRTGGGYDFHVPWTDLGDSISRFLLAFGLHPMENSCLKISSSMHRMVYFVELGR